MTQQTLLSIAHALYEAEPSACAPIRKAGLEIVLELRQLPKEQGDDGRAEPRSMAVVWLSIELARQLELPLSDLSVLRCANKHQMHRVTATGCFDSAAFRVMINAKEKHCHQRLLKVMLAP